MSAPNTDAAALASATDRPFDPRNDRRFLGHPRGLGLLFIVEMWERFSFYGMRGLLVLYLVNALQWSDGRAANLYGTYTGLVYLTPLIGGYLADRVFGTRRSLVIGGLFIAAGHFSLVLEGNMTAFYVGLALVIIGTGFFKPNVSTMVGQLYPEGDPRRDSGFTIFYMGINLGAFLAGLVCGWLAQEVGWSYGFGAAGVGMLAGLVVYLFARDRYLPGVGLPGAGGSAPEAPAQSVIDEPGATPATNVTHALLGALGGAMIALVLSGAWRSMTALGDWVIGSGGWLALLYGTIIGASIAIATLGSHGEERRRVIALFIVAFFVVFFWMAFEQAGSSMNIFADRHTDRVVAGKTIPAPWFQSVNAFFIMLFAPAFAWLWTRLREGGREPSTAMKMVIGLALLGLGFVFMVLGGREVDAGFKVSPFYLVAAYLFHTWGELCLSPVGLSYVTKVAPWRFASLLMGVWFLANSAANKLGGTLAAMTERIPSLAQFYTIPVATSLGAAVLMLLLVPLLKRLTASVKA